MRMYDIIDKKKKGTELSGEEISYAVEGYTVDEIPDYQMAAFLMAIYYQGMTDRELLAMTQCMKASGDCVDLSAVKGITVDKHSTGGVGDKTTLVVVPVVAACGGKVAKMSGRGLGYTGGTIDKLASIPGMRTAIGQEEFFTIVNRVGAAIISQSKNIAPADKKLYALRDVTATVDSIPLIASSIMSKKLASGSDKIVLDVTVGSGAFMKKKEDAVILAKKMVAIGEGAKRQTVALLTDMDQPLGNSVGNSMEVMEAVETLQGNGAEDFEEICVVFAAQMLSLSGIGTEAACRDMAQRAMRDGSGLLKFAQMVHAQGGDESYLYHTEKFPKASYQLNLTAKEDGYISRMDAELCGKASVLLGAGRETKDSEIDMAAGIYFEKKTGSAVKQGEKIAVLYANDERKAKEGLQCLEAAYTYCKEKPEKAKRVIAKVTNDGTEWY